MTGFKIYLINTMLFSVYLCLAYPALATDYSTIAKCTGLVGEQALLNCYSDNQKTIPIAKSKLPEGQELTDSYRCGTRLLYTGMTINEVQNLCPASQQPDDVEHYLQSFEIHHRSYYGFYYIALETYEMEKWTFKDYGRFRTYVVFRDSIIYQIIQDRSVRN
jgi:hypothetical protein